MNWTEILMKIFELCIIPLLGILTTYLVQWIAVKKEEIKERTHNEKVNKYLDLLEGTISNCVIATNQTYVEALKDQNAFTVEAQKHAFEMTYKQVMLILTDEAKQYLTEAVGDLQEYITAQIEAQVNLNK